MRYLLLALFIVPQAYAGELLFGSLTQHLSNTDKVADKFSNKVSEDGTLISNPLLGYRTFKREYDGAYSSYSAFGGGNSIGQPMIGVGASTGASDSNHNRIGLAGGLYAQDNREFSKLGIQVPSMPVGPIGIVPIVGLEAVKTIRLNRNTYGLANLLVTPILVNLSLGIGFD